jgi:peptidyl-prolyl cis-trans isomerase D
MALIGRIRKNFWFVLVLIFMALAAFVVMDMVGANQAGGVAGQFNIGEINGEAVDYREFQSIEQALYSGSGDIYGAKQAVWDYMVERALVTEEAQENGFVVPTEELKSLLFGANPAPIVRQIYSDPATGQFNRQALLEVKQAIEGGQQLNPTFENRWAEIEKQVRAAKLQEKISIAVAKGLYTPTWMVQDSDNRGKLKVNFDYVKVPFDMLDEEVAVSDDEIMEFVEKRKDDYIMDDETRTIKYFTMDVFPTAADTALRRDELIGLIDEFKVTDNDSLFAINNEGFFSPYFNKVEDLPEPIQDVVPGMEVGEVYGPYEDSGNFFAVKLTDSANVPDSVEAQHILISTNLAAGGMVLPEAKSFIDSLKNLIERGVQTFDSLAIKHSTDQSTAINGGDLGTFQQGRMVGPFNEVCFFGSRKGGLYTATTQFGVHLIKVNDIIFNDRDNDYQVAFVRNPITPSDETQNNLETEMSDLIIAHRSLEEMEGAIEGREDISIDIGGPYNTNDYFIEGLGTDQTSRDIIKWAFEDDNEVGAVSPELYTYSDNINYFTNKFVIVGLESITPAGMPTVNDLRLTIEDEVLKQKRGETIAGKISGTDLSAIASQWEVEVDSISNAAFNINTLPGLGNEPKVVAAAMDLSEGSTSQPIIGNSGVYVIKIKSKNETASEPNIPFIRSIMNNTVRSQTALKLMESLKSKAEIEDSRSRFF